LAGQVLTMEYMNWVMCRTMNSHLQSLWDVVWRPLTITNPESSVTTFPLQYTAELGGFRIGPFNSWPLLATGNFSPRVYCSAWWLSELVPSIHGLC
jgi:hypothetical protein